MEIQQSLLYANYIRSLGWTIERIDTMYVFIRPFSFIGGLAKIQRTIRLPEKKKLITLLKEYNIRTLVVEPDARVSQKEFTRWCQTIKSYVHINKDPYIPTKTIRISLSLSVDEMFHRLTEAKRRAVRRAQKAGVTISQSQNIDALVQVKNSSAGFLGCITTAGVKKLWSALPEKKRTILFAHDKKNKVIGGIFLFYWNHIAYYWIAGALKEGKKQFAPTLLVWEALLTSKNAGMKYFDFVGAWDERIPNKNQEWHGFTKFKEGFGGEPLYYPIVVM